MRTDTQRLDFLLQVMEQQDEEAAERIQGAFMLDLKGRTALDAAMGAKLIEPGEPMPALTAIDLAVAELGRIRNVKGFSEEMDDECACADLARAAVIYLTPSVARDLNRLGWPQVRASFKPSPDDRKKELTKGIALALCELDRLIRAERREVIGAGHDCEAQVCAEMNAAACEPEDVQPQPREFKVGDRVRIVKKAAGVGYVWDERMDVVIGSRGVIIEAAEAPRTSEPQYRVGFWYYLADSLEHVDD